MNSILLVDDEITMLKIINQIMDWNKIGIDHVYIARNAAQARDILQQKKVNITVCDIEMPQENGLDLIRWIQEIYPEIINIILTGHADFNYARSAVSLGVYRFLLKPVSFEEMEQTISEALKKTALIEEEEEPIAVQQRQKMVLQVKEYIEQHYNMVITRNDIEKLVHLNKDYINRAFKGETGYSLMEYIQFYRIGMSKKMLRSSDRSVSEIGMEVGYDSPAYFAKIFKKQTGMTPMDYRNEKV